MTESEELEWLRAEVKRLNAYEELVKQNDALRRMVADEWEERWRYEGPGWEVRMLAALDEELASYLKQAAP